MSEQEFAVGSIVKLKSGGPDMSVKSVYKEQYTCQWFAGKKLEQGVFPPQSLVPVEGQEE